MNNDQLINDRVYEVLCNVYEKIKDDVLISGNIREEFNPDTDKFIQRNFVFPLDESKLSDIENTMVACFIPYHGKNLEFKVPPAMSDSFGYKVSVSAVVYIETMIIRVSQLRQLQHGKTVEGICIDCILKV